MPLRRFLKIIAAILTLCLLFPSLSAAQENTTGGSLTVSIDDLRQVTIYTEAIEAENAALKSSLESERAAVADMLKAVNDERQAAQNYQAILEAQNAALKSESDKMRRSSSRKNYIMAILGAAVITLAVTR